MSSVLTEALPCIIFTFMINSVSALSVHCTVSETREVSQCDEDGNDEQLSEHFACHLIRTQPPPRSTATLAMFRFLKQLSNSDGCSRTEKKHISDNIILALQTQVLYRWVEPKICIENIPEAVELPVTGQREPCPPCNPGYYNSNDSTCLPCPPGTHSDGTYGKPARNLFYDLQCSLFRVTPHANTMLYQGGKCHCSV